MKIKLIANPAAGGDALRRIRQVQDHFERHACSVDLFLTTCRGNAEQAAAAARAGGYDRIVALGGDGTLNEVINGLAPSPIPLAFIPLGTVNVLALELGIPFALEEACRVALFGTPRPLALGSAGGRKFLLMAGIGFDAAVVRRVSGRLKRRIGRFAYVAAALQELCGYAAPPLQVTLADGTTEEASWVVIGNGRLYGGRFSLTPGARLDDESFEVFLLRPSGRLPLLGALLRAGCGRPPGVAARLVRTTALRIAGPAPVQVDGDDLGDLPLDFTVLPRGIVMVAPPLSPKGKP